MPNMMHTRTRVNAKNIRIIFRCMKIALHDALWWFLVVGMIAIGIYADNHWSGEENAKNISVISWQHETPQVRDTDSYHWNRLPRNRFGSGD